MRTALLIVLATTLSHPAFSQEAAASAPVEPKLARIKAVVIYPAASSPYTPELAAQGVQGTTDLRVKLSSDGAPSAVSVQSSSRSAVLDEAAIEIGKKLKFNLKDGKAPVDDLVVPVDFQRDSFAKLPDKTCADFNVDVGYFKTTFPELKPSDMKLVNATVGLLFVQGMKNASHGELRALSKKGAAAASGIVDACAQKPEANYLKTFTELFKAGAG
jgi:TonB family protein